VGQWAARRAHEAEEALAAERLSHEAELERQAREAADRQAILKALDDDRAVLSTSYKQAQAELKEVQSKKEDAVRNQNYEEAAELKTKEGELRTKIKAALTEARKAIEGPGEGEEGAEGEEDGEGSKLREVVVTEGDVAQVVAKWTGVPVEKVSTDEGARLVQLEDTLHGRVIGQEEAVTAVSKAVRRARAGLKNPNRPIASFIFCGPTGVGKTELCKALSAAYFGKEDSMIRLDMSEFMERHTVSKLIGSPPGYVGYDEESQLTDGIRRKPYSLVLFDEVEKAHPDVFNLMLQILEDGDQVSRIPNCKTMDEFYNTFGLDDTVLDDLLQYTKLMYECGDYGLCVELLKHYKTIVAVDVERQVNKDTISNIWGQLASNILTKDFKVAAELILDIHDKLEKAEKAESAQQKMPMREVLLQRTWLLHWALYAVFNSEEVDPKVLDFFLNEKSLSIISLSCPYLFRYVGACLILNKRLKLVLFDAVKVLQHECGSYSDPITRFLLALYTDMDFDEAQRELQKCRLVCKGDYFLSAQWAEFEENARLLIFERYCRIHQCINIQMIAEKLNMAPEEAELWIVKLIQSAKLDARIDSEKSRVVMSKAPPSVYQQVIEKTKKLSFRSTMLLSNLEKKDKETKETRDSK